MTDEVTARPAGGLSLDGEAQDGWEIRAEDDTALNRYRDTTGEVGE